MTNPIALDLLKLTEHYLSALHGSVARHDNIGLNLSCGGCALRDEIRDVLPKLAAAVSVPPPATRADAAPVAEVWVVWREDQPPYGYFATEDAAKHATIDYWEEDEPVCPDYSWRKDGPRWELVVGGEYGGVYASRHRVYGAPVPPPVDRGAVLREVADWAYRIARRLGDQHRDERAQGAWDVENALRAELRRATAVPGPVAGEQQNETPEDPARIDRLRPEFTEHSSIEAIDAQLRRSRAQERRWHIRTEWLISLRANRVAQKERGEWPAAGVRQDEAQS